MSPTLEEQLHTALQNATQRILAPPDLAERAIAGVSRPVRRRQTRGGRAVLVLVPIAVVAVVVAAAFAVPRLGGGTSTVAGGDLLGRPTGGDLADDPTVRTEAVDAFLADVRPQSYQSPDLPTPQPGARTNGAPQVLWAGTTGTGPAAVVAQKEVSDEGALVAVGFLGTVDDKLSLAAVSRPAEGYYDLTGSLVGTGSRTLLVLDRGTPVLWSYRHTYLPGGGIRLSDRPVAFTDGVAAIDLPADARPEDVRLTRPGPPDQERRLGLGAYPGEPADGVRLPWLGEKKDPESGMYPVGPGRTSWPEPERDDRYGQVLLAFRAAIDTVPSDLYLYGSWGDDLWYAWGDTPDGRLLAATDLSGGGDPTRAYVVLTGGGRAPTVVDGGPVDKASDVPFRVGLPDRQGWLVAAQGRQLSWRTGTGAWQDAGTDAALLPVAATAVRAGEGDPIPLR